MRALTLSAVLLLAAACSRQNRDQELAQCVEIYKTTYVEGEVRDCLVERYGWSADDAAEADRKRLSNVHPDSARLSDSGRVGATDSARAARADSGR